MSDALYVELKSLIAEIIETEDFEGDTRFVEDLEVDSMLALEILAEIERKYKLTIPEQELPQVSTLNKVYALVRQKLDARASSTAAA